MDSILDILLHLPDGRDPSTITFVDPEAGFAKLVELLQTIFRTVKEAEANAAATGESLRDSELRYAARATAAAADSANASADAADAATRLAESLTNNNGVASRAIAAAFQAAAAGYRAATAAHHAVAAAEGLPVEAEDQYYGELALDFFRESELTNSVYQLLFRERYLEPSSSVYLLLSALGQKAILVTASSLWDKLLDRLTRIKNLNANEAVDTVLKIIQSRNRTLQALLRQYLLDSSAFKDQQILGRVSQSDHATELGLNDNADLRARNLSMRPDIFTQPGGPGGDAQCSMCAQEEEEVSGRIDSSSNDDFLTFPGKLNNKPIKPLIDTGGGCNLIKAEWLKTHGIEVDPDSPKFKSLLMADGSTSKKCPCIEVRWSFDSRKKAWTDVEFVVVENYKYDALIGLPFLKHTETIHNSAGRLVFPEFKGVHVNSDSVPLYNFHVNAKFP